MAVLTEGSAQAATGAIALPLHVTGRTVYQSNGRPITFLGVNISGMEYGDGHALTLRDLIKHVSVRTGYITPEVRAQFTRYQDPKDHSKSPYAVYDNVAKWGFNTVRVPISWANLEPKKPTVVKGATVHHWNTAYLAALDQIVQQFSDRHIMVILDMHQAQMSPVLKSPKGKLSGAGLPTWLFPSSTAPSGGWTDSALRYEFLVDKVGQSGMATVWSMLAGRYKSDPYVVGADVFNEPGQRAPLFPGHPAVQFPGNYVNSMYSTMANAIRSANPNLLLMFEEQSPTAKLPLTSSGQPFSNSVFSAHVYPPPGDNGIALVAPHVAAARADNVPFWLGEFRVPCTLPDANTSGCPAVSNVNSLPDINSNQASSLSGLMSYLKRAKVSWTYWDYQALAYYGHGNARPLLLKTLKAGT